MPATRKSLDEHELQNTKPQWSKKDEAPKFEGGRPKMPKDLPEAAQAEWKRLVKELNRRGTMTRVDSSLLEIHCMTFAQWRLAAKLALEHQTTIVTWTDKNGEPHTKETESAASALATKLANACRNSLKELSATPASREKTKPTKQLPSKKEIDPNSREGLA
jgi:P27 family predicted phage terminase small subunit